MLKHRLDNLDGVTEDVAQHYEAGQDGAFYLQVQGMVPKKRLDEFRDNNIALAKERDELVKALDAGGETTEIESLVAERTGGSGDRRPHRITNPRARALRKGTRPRLGPHRAVKCGGD